MLESFCISSLLKLKPSWVANSDLKSTVASNVFSRGLALNRIPTIDDLMSSQLEHQLKSQFGSSNTSMQKQFLADFVDNVPDTAGARLARWIEDLNYALPANCIREFLSGSSEVALGETFRYRVLTFDASKSPIDAPISSLAARVVSRLEDLRSPYEGDVHKKDAFCINARTGEQYCCVPDAVFHDLSFEEHRLRLQSHRPGPPLVTKSAPGQFTVMWSPARAGSFLFHLEVDGQDISGSPFEISVKPSPVVDSKAEEQVFSMQLDDENEDQVMQLPPCAYVSLVPDLVIQGGPSRDTIEMGRVPMSTVLQTTGELESTEDGVWVKLAQAAVDLFVDADFRFMDAWVPVLSLPAFGGVEFLRLVEAQAIDQPKEVADEPASLWLLKICFSLIFSRDCSSRARGPG